MMIRKRVDTRTKISMIGFALLLLVIGVFMRLEKSWLADNSNQADNLLLNESMSMQLTSSQFKHQETVPVRYTCDGEDISPPLTWSDVPEGVKSFTLIVRDPDAPAKPEWIHWIVKNIPADVWSVDENDVPHNSTNEGELVTNDFGKAGWGGPCPSNGEHRYFFNLYALDIEQVSGDSLVDVEAAMDGHILDKAELMATYQRLASN